MTYHIIPVFLHIKTERTHHGDLVSRIKDFLRKDDEIRGDISLILDETTNDAESDEIIFNREEFDAAPVVGTTIHL